MSDIRECVTREPREEVKRALRQESGFGCCVCGTWIIQYHHIVEFSTEEHHRAEDMMIICPNCHARATAHAMPEAEQRRHKASPYNIRHGQARGQLYIDRPIPLVEAGSNVFGRNGPIIVADGEPLLSLRVDEDGQLLTSLVLRDEEDNVIGTVVDNEWTYGDPLPWDIRAEWRRLYVRNEARTKCSI